MPPESETMKTKFIQVRCGPEDKKRARVGAARRDKQLSAYIRELIREDTSDLPESVWEGADREESGGE